MAVYLWILPFSLRAAPCGSHRDDRKDDNHEACSKAEACLVLAKDNALRKVVVCELAGTSNGCRDGHLERSL